MNADMLETVLKGLAHMSLDERPILGDRKNIQQAWTPNDYPPAKKQIQPLPGPGRDGEPNSIISTSDGDRPRHTRQSKATQLMRLSKSVTEATDNHALSSLVSEFAEVLRNTGSRTLTREGFSFLDALHKQLADPSVFVVPLRTSRTRSGRSKTSAGGESAADASQDQSNGRRQVNTLWARAQKAQSNKALADLVAEFGTLTDKSASRTLTKLGITFLDEVARRLTTVR